MRDRRSYSSALLLLAVLSLLLFVCVSAHLPDLPAQSRPRRQLGSSNWQSQQKCELIRMKQCKDMPYNMTLFPNLINIDRQEDAEADFNNFQPLLNVACSKNLKKFLCSVYAPICVLQEAAGGLGPQPMIVKPCQQLCNSVREGCAPLMEKFGFSWPEIMKCNNFPVTTCVPDSTESASQPTATSHYETVSNRSTRRTSPRDCQLEKFFSCSRCQFSCPAKLKTNKDSYYVLRLDEDEYPNCGYACQMFFTDDQVQFARHWLGIWAFICLFACLFAVLTFISDLKRFRYPERPLIYIALCYLVVSSVYVAGYFLVDSLACTENARAQMNYRDQMAAYEKLDVKLSVGKSVPAPERPPKIVTQATQKEACTVLFIVAYFFFNASLTWWVSLCVAWFLAAALKWSSEAMDRVSHFFQLASWTLPAVQTITLLAMQRVEGDPLSGICYTGVLNVKMHKLGVVLPHVFYLSLGFLFLLAGFISMYHIRSLIKNEQTSCAANSTTATPRSQETSIEKFEKLMLRIGIFAVLYIIAHVVIICCEFHELALRGRWLSAWLLRQSYDDLWSQGAGCRADLESVVQRTAGTISSDEQSFSSALNNFLSGHLTDGRPNFSVLLLKYLMLMLAGAISSLWVWNRKTFAHWGSLVCPCWCGPYRQGNGAGLRAGLARRSPSSFGHQNAYAQQPVSKQEMQLVQAGGNGPVPMAGMPMVNAYHPSTSTAMAVGGSELAGQTHPLLAPAPMTVMGPTQPGPVAVSAHNGTYVTTSGIGGSSSGHPPLL